MQKEATIASVAHDWKNIMAAPARFVHPERIVACYDGAISLGIATSLQASERVERPLAILLMDHFDLSALPDLAQLDEADLILMTSPAGQIENLVPLAGAIFWSHVFAGEIRTNEVAEMKRLIGEAAFQTALANRDLASNLPGPDDRGALETMMASDGIRCVAAWHDALPHCLGAWARLKHANDSLLATLPDLVHRELGPEIMRRLAAKLLSLRPTEGVQ